jgi:hypothetical protein
MMTDPVMNTDIHILLLKKEVIIKKSLGLLRTKAISTKKMTKTGKR